MDKPTHHDVDVILKLYDLRREDRMRKARSWLFGYKAGNAAEHQAACPPGSDQDAYYRMVTSYWDMAASFVTSGAVNKELFLQSAGEMLFVWEKTKGTIADSRKAALAMFPGKELAYDLIWRPRFQRLMRERFRIM